MDALTTVLVREKLLVELLAFKLVELRQLLIAGETRFLAWAAEEVDRASTAVRNAEVERAVLVSALAEERGLGDDPTLTAIVADAPEPWRTLLADTQEGLRAGADEVASLLTATRRLADAGSRSLADTLRRLDGDDGEPAAASPAGYGPGWTHTTSRARVEQHL